MLDIQNINCKSSKNFDLNIPKLHLKPGQVISVLGQNGAGKSTFLRMLAGDYTYTGDLSLHRKCLNQYKALDRARHIAMLTQDYTLNFAFKAIEVVALGASPLQMHATTIQQVADENMRCFDCHLFKERYFFDLSGGQQQRVQLARLLVQVSQAPQHPILLLDEPISAQDLKYQHQVMQRLQHLAVTKNYLIFVVLHDLTHALHYSHYSLIFHQGNLVQQGPTQETLTPHNIEKYWDYKPQKLSAGKTNFFF